MRSSSNHAQDSHQSIPPLGFRIWKREPATMEVMTFPHSHSELEINYLRYGVLRYLHGGRTIRIEAGSWVLFWAGIPHRTIETSPDLCGIWITFPLNWLLTWDPAGGMKERLLSGEMLLVNGESDGRDAQLFESWRQDFESGAPNRYGQVRLELEARIRRLGLSLPLAPQKPQSAARRDGARFSAERTAAFLTCHYQEPLTVDRIAEALRLHPKYLLQSFKNATGLTLWNYLTRLRLAHAQRLLLTTDLTVLEIALESGFGSSSSFYRRFQQLNKESPQVFRRKQLALI